MVISFGFTRRPVCAAVSSAISLSFVDDDSLTRSMRITLPGGNLFQAAKNYYRMMAA
jgi:hypothetical protein